jgi:hypothetical protein
MAEALHQAEQARLIRLARPETATRRPRWMALQQHMMFVMVKSGADALLILSPCSYTPE